MLMPDIVLSLLYGHGHCMGVRAVRYISSQGTGKTNRKARFDRRHSAESLVIGQHLAICSKAAPSSHSHTVKKLEAPNPEARLQTTSHAQQGGRHVWWRQET
eukprot:scaffold140040_cov17-Tisochrysis_lutea.AAC.2